MKLLILLMKDVENMLKGWRGVFEKFATILGAEFYYFYYRLMKLSSFSLLSICFDIDDEYFFERYLKLKSIDLLRT